MIVFDLECRTGAHRFEGWFGSSDDFARQQERGLVSCPMCGSIDVGKAVMAPNVGRKGNQAPIVAPRRDAPAPARAAVSTGGPTLPPQVVAMLHKVAAAQAEAIKSSRWVGEQFADEARAMHYGDRDMEAIHGRATAEEAAALVEEGVEIAPLLIPVVPPEQTN